MDKTWTSMEPMQVSYAVTGERSENERDAVETPTDVLINALYEDGWIETKAEHGIVFVRERNELHEKLVLISPSADGQTAAEKE